MERRFLGLGNVFGLAEHLTRSRKVEPALRNQIGNCRQHKVGAIDIGIESRKLVVEGITDETLGSEMVTLVRTDLRDYLVHAGVAFERCGVQHDFVAYRLESQQTVLR